jgi:hypothetical protein
MQSTIMPTCLSSLSASSLRPMACSSWATVWAAEAVSGCVAPRTCPHTYSGIHDMSGIHADLSHGMTTRSAGGRAGCLHASGHPSVVCCVGQNVKAAQTILTDMRCRAGQDSPRQVKEPLHAPWVARVAASLTAQDTSAPLYSHHPIPVPPCASSPLCIPSPPAGPRSPSCRWSAPSHTGAAPLQTCPEPAGMSWHRIMQG